MKGLLDNQLFFASGFLVANRLQFASGILATETRCPDIAAKATSGQFRGDAPQCRWKQPPYQVIRR
jgi:hypothetical protein